jgi:hypothetical protein
MTPTDPDEPRRPAPPPDVPIVTDVPEQLPEPEEQPITQPA